MAWTTKQVRLANQAAREAGLTVGSGKSQDTSARDLLLRQLSGRAIDPRAERMSTRSPQLTQADFEWFMSQAEVRGDDGGVGGQPFGYWQEACREGRWKRLRWKAQKLADKVSQRIGAGYCHGAITAALGEWSDDLDNCDEAELRKVIDALTQIHQRPMARSAAG